MSAASSWRRALCILCLLLTAVPFVSANNRFYAPDEVCPLDEFTVIARWCPCPRGGMLLDRDNTFKLQLEAIGGSPAPYAELVSYEPLDNQGGIAVVLRAGPNPGLLRVYVEANGDASRAYSGTIRIGGGGSTGSSCATCGDGSGSHAAGTERVSVDDGMQLDLFVGTHHGTETTFLVENRFEKREVHLSLASQSPGMIVEPNKLLFTGIDQGNNMMGDLGRPYLCDHRYTDTCDNGCIMAVPVGGGGSSTYYDAVAAVYDLSANVGYPCLKVELVTDTNIVDNAGEPCCLLYQSENAEIITRWHIYQPNAFAEPPDYRVVVERYNGDDEQEIKHVFQCEDGVRNWSVTTSEADVQRRQSVTWEELASEWVRRYEIAYTLVPDPVAADWVPEHVEETHHDSPDEPWTEKTIDPIAGGPRITREFATVQGLDMIEWTQDGSAVIVDIEFTYSDHQVVTGTDSAESGSEYITYTPIGGELTVKRHHGWLSDNPDEYTYYQTIYSPMFTDDPDTGAWFGLAANDMRHIVNEQVVSRRETVAATADPYNTRIVREYFGPNAQDYLETAITYEEPGSCGSGNCFWWPQPVRSRAQREWVSRTLPNGIVQLRAVENGWFVSDTKSLGWGPGPYKIVVTTSTTSGSQRPALAHAEVYDTQARLVFRCTGHVEIDQIYFYYYFVHDEWTHYEYDARGRIVGTYHSNGTFETTAWEDCCQARTITDSDGVVTRIQADALGRVVSEVRLVGTASSQANRSITTYTYEGVSYGGRTLPAVTIRRGYDNLPSVTDPIDGFTVATRSRTISDLAGRVVAEMQLDATDTPAMTTTYAYGTSAVTGGREVTRTRPDGRTETHTYHKDGQLHSITGTGVVHQFFEYEVVAGEIRRTVHMGSDQDVRESTTVTDMLGRTKREERPGWNSTTLATAYTYNPTTGELEAVETSADGTPVMAPTLYEVERDADWERRRSGMDVDDDGELVLASTDRITETQTQRDTVGNLTWDVTTVCTYGTPNDGTPVSIRTEKRLLRGFTNAPACNCNDPSHTGLPLVAYSETTDEAENIVQHWTYVDRSNCRRIVYEKHSDWSNYAVQVWEYGLLVSSRSRTGVTTTYGYDGLGRQVSVSEGRTTTVTEYDDLGRVWKTRDALNNETVYEYYAQGSLGAGQVRAVTDALSKKTYYGYDAYGRLITTWGDTPQPTKIKYTPYGERWELHTYRSESNWSSFEAWANAEEWPAGDVTTWTYDAATGLLVSKADADSQSVTYTYKPDGRLLTRAWARGVGTTYIYNDGQGGRSFTGELAQVNYSDDTPDVTYSYDRRGRTLTAASDSLLSYAYDYTAWPVSVSVSTTGLYDKTITQTFAADRGGELTQLAISSSGQPEYAANYEYAVATGRLATVNGPGLVAVSSVTPVVSYGYVSGSNLVEELKYLTGDERPNNIAIKTTRAFEDQRDILRSISHEWGSSGNWPISAYDYTQPGSSPVTAADALGRRTDLTATMRKPDNQMLSSAWTFAHNARNELIDVARTAPVAAWQYTYDPIGNRTDYDNNGTPFEYETNNVNQYLYVGQTTQPGAMVLDYDADGNLIEQFVAGDMNCDGQVNWRDTDPFVMAMNNCCAEPTLSCPRWPPTWPDPSCDCLNGDLNGDGQVTWRDLDLYVASQNTSGGAVYLWDAENRLIEYRPLIPVTGSRKVTFAYDYQGRRIAKRVYNWSSGQWVLDPLEERRFVWHEWLMLEELGGPSGAGQGGTGYQPVRSYTWGLDLAGLNGSVNSLQAAGGIGGLLAVHQAALDRPGTSNDVAAGDYGFTYDGNGNVVQVVNVSDYGVGNFWWQAVRTMAVYEYDAYGNVIGPDTNADGQFNELDNVGPYAAENPIRFSTKYFDRETGLGYWGYRYYSPALGRWVSRDPILMRGFNPDEATLRTHALRLYARFMNDAPLDYVAFDNAPTADGDPLGLSPLGNGAGSEFNCKTTRITQGGGPAIPNINLPGLFVLKVDSQVRGTITTCSKCCDDGRMGEVLRMSIDTRISVQVESPTARVMVGPVPMKFSAFGGGAGGLQLTKKTDTCTGLSVENGCGFLSFSLGGQGCAGALGVDICLRCEGNYSRRWCVETPSSGCFSARCMARAKTWFNTYDYVFWQTPPCRQDDGRSSYGGSDTN